MSIKIEEVSETTRQGRKQSWTLSNQLTRKRKRVLVDMLVYSLLSLGLILMTFPYVWMVLASIKPGEEIFTRFFPTQITWQNYIDLITANTNLATGSKAFSLTPIWVNFLNSVIVATVPAVSVVVTGAITGYAIAKLPFPGRNLLTNWVLAQMTIPFFLIIIPLFTIVIRLNAINTYHGMFLPFLTAPVSVFLFAQFFRSIPDDLLDSARIDGLSELGIVFRIMMPLATGVAAIVWLFTFMSNWNEFIWHLLVGRAWAITPLSVILGSSSNVQLGSDFARLMALSTIMTLPIIIMFLFARRYFVEGIALTGLKL